MGSQALTFTGDSGLDRPAPGHPALHNANLLPIVGGSLLRLAESHSKGGEPDISRLGGRSGVPAFEGEARPTST
jgi:hypothetical protein